MKKIFLILLILIFQTSILNLNAQQRYSYSELGFSLKYGNIDRSQLFGNKYVIAEDFNNDRSEDVAKYEPATGMLNYYQNEGNGYFIHTKSISVGYCESISLMKINNTQRNIQVKYSNGTVRIITNSELNGIERDERLSNAPFITSDAGEFNLNEVYTSISYRYFWNVVAGDIDNDGKNEVIFSSRPDTLYDCNYAYIYVFESSGDNNYVLDWDTTYIATPYYYNSCLGLMAITDLDHNGKKEILFKEFDYLKGFECLGPRQYKYFRTNIQTYWSSRPDDNTTAIREYDIDRDNVKELIVVNTDGHLSYNNTWIHLCKYIGRTDTMMFFGIKRVVYQGLCGDIDFGDINGDGKGEIVVSGAGGGGDGDLAYFDSTGSGILWYGNGGAGYEYKTITTGRDLGPGFVLARDLDNDNKKELLMSAAGLGFGGFAVIRNLHDSVFNVEMYDTTLPNNLGSRIAFTQIDNRYYVFYPRTRMISGQDHGYMHVYKHTGGFLFDRVYDKDFYPSVAIFTWLNLLDIDNDNKINIVTTKISGSYPLNYYMTDIENEFPIGIINGNGNVPVKYSLSQNYPNPFNPKTIIRFAIPSNVKRETSNVKLIIFDILGREVATLVNEKLKPGTYEVDWDGSGFASGIYFYVLKTEDGFYQAKKMVLIK